MFERCGLFRITEILVLERNAKNRNYMCPTVFNFFQQGRYLEPCKFSDFVPSRMGVIFSQVRHWGTWLFFFPLIQNIDVKTKSMQKFVSKK
jgi:hypothetical protein